MARNKNGAVMPEEKLDLDNSEAAQPQAEKHDFEEWYSMRMNQIDKHHHKEILKADFKARGLGQCESLEDFDRALRKYGVKLA